ncbi:hypothetical protein A0123_00211 [Gluconobacter cerinus]|uniref:Uncharacterized protein n=2 Tax=Gluconobacter cerinus TaxID=38307 RepID=A0A1B6VQA2_9PROT|nr:hypothetical protein A0123_00211 [Gluconobacter cerinus]
MLILPIVAHRGMVKQLSHARFRFIGFEQYFIEHAEFFYNFGERYTANLAPTVNALQLLNEIRALKLQNGGAASLTPIPIDKAMGNRADRIHRASANIADLISGSTEIFYLNSRIEL